MRELCQHSHGWDRHGTYTWSAVRWGSGVGATDSFFACATGVLTAGPGAALVVEGRVVAGLEDAASEARAVGRVVVLLEVVLASAAGRDARGRFAAAAVVEGATDGLAKVLPGEARGAVLAAVGVLRIEGFLVSSPEVTDERSGSASDAVLDATPALRVAAAGTERVGGRFRLDPAVLAREVAVEAGFDAVVGARAPEAAGRRGGIASLEALDAVPAGVVNRRDAAASLEVDAIVRRGAEVGVLATLATLSACCRVASCKLSRGAAAPSASLVGAILGVRGRRRSTD